MRLNNSITLASTFVVAALLGGCGGGGGTTTAGIGGTGLPVTGTITNFGSVFVNGVEYNTDNATVYVNGVEDVEGSLDHGMVVTVHGAIDANNAALGTAQTVYFNSILRGPVTSNDIAISATAVKCTAELSNYTSGTGVITSLGQTVYVDPKTLFVDSAGKGYACFDEIQAGDVVEVSGYSDGAGNAFATRIELVTANGIELRGVISGLDTTAMTFSVGTQQVDYSSATDIGIATLANGLYVDVRGGLTAGVLVADSVNLGSTSGQIGTESWSGDDGADEIEIYGVITSPYNPFTQALELNGQTVKLITSGEDATEIGDDDFVAMYTVNDLTFGTYIQLEAEFVNGELVADEIKFESQNTTEYQGMVTAVDLVNSQVTLSGGQVITVTTSTLIIDDIGDKYFTLNELAAGDNLEVKAYQDATGGLTALKMERY